MHHTIQNDFLKVEIAEEGAELQSIIVKNTGKEHLWQGDTTFWPRRAPLLFPIVGRLKNDTMTFKGNEYNMHQHGFARDLHFSVEKMTDQSILLTSASSPETRQKYPFDWKLDCSYELDGNMLKASASVTNTSSSDLMYFSIGFHPGFVLPMDGGLTFDEYQLYFNKDHSAKRWKIEGALIGDELSNNTINDYHIQLSYALFETDALVFKGLKSDEIIIKNSKSDSRLHFTFQNFPFLGIWTKPEAPYLCLEPWHGIADSICHNGDFTVKEGIQTLDPNNTFQCGYGVGFH
ncbi:MAG: aldose 1-epimerase family protein [Saprospiraceae bacterium]|jgi:galactose mutarotase-like enzyme|nr:aldose 1-epimerase family protein [Saprospiraceae bacterium]